MYCRLLCSVTTCNWNRYYCNINLYYLSNRCDQFCSWSKHSRNQNNENYNMEFKLYGRSKRLGSSYTNSISNLTILCSGDLAICSMVSLRDCSPSSSSSISAWSTFADGGDRAFLGYCCSAANLGTWLLVLLLLRTRSAPLEAFFWQHPGFGQSK